MVKDEVKENQMYIDFDEYIRQGEPDQKEKAGYWQTAIGLQAVDGLTTSDYLKETARKHIEGEINIDEARELVNQYYITKTIHDANDADKEEADRVSSNIVKVLSSPTFNFSTGGYQSVHRRVFEGVMKHAGELRTYDITKKEWVLEWDLRNRYLHINPTKEWGVQPNLATHTSTRTSILQVPEQVPEQVHDLLHTNNVLVKELIKVIGNEELSVSQMMERTGLKHRPNFIEYHLNPSIFEGFVRLLYPDKPRHPRQKYLLTVKGQMLYKELTNA